MIQHFPQPVLSIGGSTLVSYTYLGAGSVMRVDYEQPDVRLDLWGGTAGAYDGIDRFGRVTDHRWAAYNSSSTDWLRITHGYDRSSNRLCRRDEVAGTDLTWSPSLSFSPMAG